MAAGDGTKLMEGPTIFNYLPNLACHSAASPMLVIIVLLFVHYSSGFVKITASQTLKFLHSQRGAIGIGSAILYKTVKIHENKWLPFTSVISRDITGDEPPQIFGFLDW